MNIFDYRQLCKKCQVCLYSYHTHTSVSHHHGLDWRDFRLGSRGGHFSPLRSIVVEDAVGTIGEPDRQIQTKKLYQDLSNM